MIFVRVGESSIVEYSPSEVVSALKYVSADQFRAIPTELLERYRAAQQLVVDLYNEIIEQNPQPRLTVTV